MSEWKEVRLGDITDIIGDGIHGTPVYDENGEYFFINGSNLYKGKIIINNDTKKIGYEEYLKHKKVLNKNTILLSINGTIGNIALYNGEKCILGKSACYININHLFDKFFIFYILSSHKFLKEITFKANGTTIKNVSLKQIRDYTFYIPSSYEKQKEIAGILSSLDAKIETNNKLNEKLEEMAQAIFKSWFVDFEPFKDKPFHETGLGMIPEGWEVSTFSSIIEKLISGDWGKETPTGNYVHKVACIRGCDFENIKNGLRGKTPERFILERNFASKQPKPNDIVVEMSGGTATVSTGRICYITKELLDQYGGDIVCTNFCKIVRPLKGWSQYLYYYWQYKYDKKVMFCYENGTSGIKNFAINDFIDIESLLIPPKDELIKFNSIIDNIRVKIQMNGVENTRLASLRDTLLPRLMSGELIV